MCKDRDKKRSWSEKYKNKTEVLKDPALFIKNNIYALNNGTLLDLACGDGSNAIFLAKKGFEVTGVDFSEEALNRLSKFSDIENVKVNTKIVDVDDVDEVLALGKFDNIIISKFKPKIELFKELYKILNKNGKIILTSFNYRHSEINGFRREFCLEENEFADISEYLELIKLESFEDNENYLDGYMFKLL